MEKRLRRTWEIEPPSVYGRFLETGTQKMSARPLRTHDACGSKVKKVMSAGSFAFKGGGFYQTDYKAAPACEKKSPDSPACASCPSAKA